mmetsp:Transcript_24747/g.40020  ORF Transcript_24747/g.40020 Transcript_24747/m.40020 type:complete len:105 (-) Transcript_24747:772-1086(-)
MAAPKEEQIVMHKWSFNCSFDESVKKVVLKVSDSVTEKKWINKLDCKDIGISEAEYTEKFANVLNDEQTALGCVYPDDDNTPLQIIFKDQSGKQLYQFALNRDY